MELYLHLDVLTMVLVTGNNQTRGSCGEMSYPLTTHLFQRLKLPDFYLALSLRRQLYHQQSQMGPHDLLYPPGRYERRRSDH